MIQVTYGLNVTGDDDELVSLFGETLHRIIQEGAPGACTIDLFPFRESFIQLHRTVNNL